MGSRVAAHLADQWQSWYQKAYLKAALHGRDWTCQTYISPSYCSKSIKSKDCVIFSSPPSLGLAHSKYLINVADSYSFSFIMSQLESCNSALGIPKSVAHEL